MALTLPLADNNIQHKLPHVMLSDY